jgi:hypothetical protein
MHASSSIEDKFQTHCQNNLIEDLYRINGCILMCHSFNRKYVLISDRNSFFIINFLINSVLKLLAE